MATMDASKEMTVQELSKILEYLNPKDIIRCIITEDKNEIMTHKSKGEACEPTRLTKSSDL